MTKRVSDDELSRIAQTIKTTGFVLEHAVATTFRRHGWTVLSNRYYIDDHTESAREIDLIAYRVKRLGHFSYRDVLIISCKKSEENHWAFLVRDVNKRDPNIEWHPVTARSNLKSINFMMQRAGWRDGYLEHLRGQGLYEALIAPTDHQFAFQEIAKGLKTLEGGARGKKASVQNDTNIFRAVSSLMKAQAYTMATLEGRADPRVYMFHLLSVADTELIKLHFSDGGEIRASEIEEARHVVNYIVNKKEVFARVHFIRADQLDAVLSRYDVLFEANSAYFKDLEKDFYRNIVADRDRLEVFSDEFAKELEELLFWETDANASEAKQLANAAYLGWSESKNALAITLDLSEKRIGELNESKKVRERAGRLLKKIYRYDGPSVFDEDIPF